MKIQDYEKVQDLLKSKEKLNKLRRIFCYPYPRIFCPLKKFLFFYGDVGEICFISFDEQTQKELKESIQQVINKRLKEIEEEIENI